MAIRRGNDILLHSTSWWFQVIWKVSITNIIFVWKCYICLYIHTPMCYRTCKQVLFNLYEFDLQCFNFNIIYMFQCNLYTNSSWFNKNRLTYIIVCKSGSFKCNFSNFLNWIVNKYDFISSILNLLSCVLFIKSLTIAVCWT